MKKLRSILSFALVFFMIFGLAPQITTVRPISDIFLANGNIEVVVSAKNGGFVIRTGRRRIIKRMITIKNCFSIARSMMPPLPHFRLLRNESVVYLWGISSLAIGRVPST